MLVLSRETDESIHVGIMPGVEIKITLIEIRGNKARIGITCPRQFPILRNEIYEETGGFKNEDFPQ